MRIVKRIITVNMALLFLMAGNVMSGDVVTDSLITDRLTVNKDASFYGNVTLMQPDTLSSNGLVFYARMNSSSLPVTDDSGYNNTGTVYNSAQWVSGGRQGGAYDFNGTSYLRFGTTTGSMNLTNNAVTISSWVWWRSGVHNEGWILMKGSSYALGIYKLSGQYYLTMPMNTGSGWGDNISTGVLPNPPTGAWHHVAATYNGSAISLYWDGVKIGSDIAKSGNLVPSAFPLFVAREGVWNSQCFKGLIDEVGIYNRALSSNEVVSAYNFTMNSSAGWGTLTAKSFVSSNAVSQTSATATNVFMGKIGIGTSVVATNALLAVGGNVSAQTFMGSGNSLTNLNGANIANATITGAKLVNSTITATQIASATITATQLANGSVTTGKLDLATVDARYVNATGDSMSGALQVSTNGLKVGSNQFVVINGRIGIGTNNPSTTFEVNGGAKFKQGIMYVAPLNNLNMGVYTNGAGM